MSEPAAGDKPLVETLDAVVRDLDLAHESEPADSDESIAAMRRRRGRPRGSRLATVTLVRVDGVLRWTYQRPPRVVGRRRALRAGGLPVGGDRLFSFGFKEVPPNAVVEQLEKLDQKLTPARGLRRWRNGALEAVTAPDATPRALLLIHGTFSKSDMFFSELPASKDGREFLNRAAQHYKQVLAFDHPTLSVSPLLNALDLERAMGGYAGTVDVVCHSRGGLVTAWWLRTGLRKVGKVVFVASPLEGTSLAAPARIKESLDALANIAHAVQGMAAMGGAFVPPAAPILGMASGLMQVLGGVLSLGARSPLLDAGVSVVAGLASQSRVSNNQELLRLHESAWPSTPKCFAVRSDFQPVDPDAPGWAFWKKLRRPLISLADTVVDPVFDGPNDLVVDASSMTKLLGVDLPPKSVLDFAANNRVHHVNYFAQPETAAFLTRTLMS